MERIRRNKQQACREPAIVWGEDPTEIALLRREETCWAPGLQVGEVL